MKKRILSLALALVIMVGIAPTAFAGARYDSPSMTLVRTYRNAMALYDLTMTTTDHIDIRFVPGNVFLDPREAWDSYITNEKCNNWFTDWYDAQGSGYDYGCYDEGVKARFQDIRKPSNIYPDSPEWWAMLDSYVTNVITEDHAIDTNITWDSYHTDGSPYDPDTFTFEDEMWAEWYEVTVVNANDPQYNGYAPYKDMSLQEWTEMRTAMSEEEDTLFDEWLCQWGAVSGAYKTGRTFEEYKKYKGFSENQPTLPSTKPVPTEDGFVIENGVLTRYEGPGGDVVIPDGVTEINGTVFEHGTNLTSVTIPTSVTKIDCYAFVFVRPPHDVYYRGTKEQWDAIQMAYIQGFYNPLEHVTIHYNSDGSTTRPTPAPGPLNITEGDFRVHNGMLTNYYGPGGDVVIPDGVTEIISPAFSDCTSLTSVVIPDGVTKIGDSTFYGCTGLTSVTIPSSVTKIDRFAFAACSSLTSVVIPDGVTEIGEAAFGRCGSLTSITIPTSVTKIFGASAIGDDSLGALKDIYYGGSKEQWEALGIDTKNGLPWPVNVHYAVETQPVQHFADVSPDAWYFEAVNNMAEAGILKGKGDGLFHPNDNITNAEVATIICRIGQSASERYVAFGDPNSKYYSEYAINHMTHWAERAIEASVASTNGTAAGTFYASVETADNACSRRSVFEAMAMLAYEDQFPQYWHPEYLHDGQVPADGRIYYIKKLNVTYEEQMAAKSEIHDIRDTDFGTMTCWVLGIIHGDGNGYVHPDAGITRAELCQILYNMGAKTCYLDI